MTNEQKILLHLVAKALQKNKQLPFNEKDLRYVDWGAVAKESFAQAVALMAFDSANDYRQFIPQEVFNKWQKLCFSIVNTNYKVYQSQADLIALLNENNINYIILKGAAASAYYNNPEIRVQGDVDFLVADEQKEQTEKILIGNGYEKSLGDHPNHIVFKKDFAHLEMHFEVAGVPHGWRGEVVRQFLCDATKNVEQKTQTLSKFNAPIGINHALILILHMQHHMLGEGLGLRHLCDWAMFVNRTKEQGFWKEFVEFLEKIGLKIYAMSITKTCANYFKIACPDWAKNADDELCREIIEDVFLGGNFGMKDGNRARSGVLISNRGKDGTKHGKLYNLTHALHRATLSNYPIVKKIWILYPFLYVYKGFKFIFLSMIGKRPSIIKMIPQSQKRKNVYDKLKVFESEE